jgi:starch synthase (maltosyl-transferring)
MSESRIYYLHPLLAGRIDAWGDHLDRIAAMGFDTVVIAPPFLPGASGDLFRTGDHDRLDPRLGTGDAVAALGRLAEEARDHGLLLMLDVVVDQVAAEALLRDGFSAWYRSDADDEPPDPRQPPRQSDIADLCTGRNLSGVAAGWTKRLVEWADAGVAGFWCIRPHHVPSGLWRELIAGSIASRAAFGHGIIAPADLRKRLITLRRSPRPS